MYWVHVILLGVYWAHIDPTQKPEPLDFIVSLFNCWQIHHTYTILHSFDGDEKIILRPFVLSSLVQHSSGKKGQNKNQI